MLHPKTLRVLLDAGRDVVSEVFRTAWQPGAPELPQVRQCDTYSLHEARYEARLTEAGRREHAATFIAQLRVPGRYRVGGLGACPRVGRRALELGARFERIYNLSFPREARQFCVRAAALGLELFVDTHVPAYPIYRDGHVDGLAAFVCRTVVGRFEMPFRGDGTAGATPPWARPNARGSRPGSRGCRLPRKSRNCDRRRRTAPDRPRRVGRRNPPRSG